MEAASQVSSVIGFGQEFDGADDYIDLGASASLDGAAALTISFWCYADSVRFPSISGIFSRGSNSRQVPMIYGVPDQDYLLFRMETPDNAGDGEVITTGLTRQNWHYISFTWDGSVVTAYVDAVPGAKDNTEGTVLSDTDGDNFIGNVSGDGKWDGKLDELRVSRKARSADWIKLSYETQKMD
ncbi:MAG: LamG domain-containing protein [Fibrobacteria bacterium]|nr:LamG domain-containing protein [Fibrobacteria bacterium]